MFDYDAMPQDQQIAPEDWETFAWATLAYAMRGKIGEHAFLATGGQGLWMRHLAGVHYGRTDNGHAGQWPNRRERLNSGYP